MSLFFATFHANVEFGLASLSSVILHAGPLLIATLCACLLSLHWIVDAKKTKHHHDSNDDSHDDFLPMQLTAGRIIGITTLHDLRAAIKVYSEMSRRICSAH
jgi:hypothetical protein